jgi:hypothetical protein
MFGAGRFIPEAIDPKLLPKLPAVLKRLVVLPRISIY